MKKLLSFTVCFLIAIFSAHTTEYRVYPAYGKIYSSNKTEIDKNEYREVTFREFYEITENAKKNRKVDSLRDLKFKTKCHVTSIEKVYGTQWKRLTLYCDGEKLRDFLAPNGALFPDNAMFESIEVYYYFHVYSDGSLEREDFGFEILPDARFVGLNYVAADNLRLRDKPSLDSEKTGLILKGESVTVLEVGQEEKIDRIKSSWVKVRASDGKEGWSFGGYLTDGEIYFEKYPWE